MKKIVLLTLLCLTIINVKAYENNYFEIDIPDNYKLEEKDNTYKWTNNNDYVYLNIIDNKNNNNIKKYTNQDIDKHKEYLLNTYKKNINDNIEITSIEIINNKDIYYLEYSLIINTKKSIGYTTYQKGRIYTSDNYIYNLLISSDKEIKNNDILNSFKYKDDYPISLNIKKYLILLSILLILILILDYLITKKHHLKK